jgi:hypothetical protein
MAGRHFGKIMLFVVASLIVSIVAGYGQQTQTSAVPHLITFNGVLKSSNGQLLSGVMGIQFALYQDQEGGAPLWSETQNAQLDSQGRYAVLLGSTQTDGLPMDLFTTGQSRWLGVQAQLPGEVEQPRVLLVSVPYALKAADADTIGGKPASAFVLAQPATEDNTASNNSSSSNSSTANPKIGAKAPLSPGTQNAIAKFAADGTTLINSTVTENSGNVGIGTGTPGSQLQVASGLAGTNSGDVFSLTSSDGIVRSDISARGLQTWRLNSGSADVGQIGYSTPGGSPGIILWTGAGFNQNRFNLVNYGSAFSLGYDVDANGTGQVLNVRSGGNVGIGTANPASQLHVSSSLAGNNGADVFSLTSSDGILRSDISARGLQTWRLNSGVADVGQIAYATPGGSPGIVMWTGSTFNQNRFNLVNYGSAFSLGYDADAGGTGQVLNIKSGGNVGIGTANPAAKLDVVGNVNSNGTVSGAQLVSTVATGTPPLAVNSTTQVANLNASLLGGLTATAARTRAITYLGGCDTCSVLADTDDQGTIYLNTVGAMTITSVTCFSDAGNPVINLTRNGTPANTILSSNLSCSPTPGANTTTFTGQSVLQVGDTLDFVMVTAGGTAKRVTVSITAVLN